MSAMIHFGTDGWRARRDGGFTEENVIRVADAVGSYWSQTAPGSVVYVGYDTRPGADSFARTMGQVLAGYGLEVKVSDRYVPTPALSWAIANVPRACGGVMITGSHNSQDYLGIKLRISDGTMGSEELYEDVEDLIPFAPSSDKRGTFTQEDLVTPYLERLAGLVDVQKIADARLKIIYDSMYGSASGYGSDILVRVGVETAEIHAVGTGNVEDIRPEPIEPWVDACENAVVSYGAQAGLINDGDGDRIGAVDENGRFVSQQKIIALVLGHLAINRGMTGRVVLNLASSVLARRVAKDLGFRVVIKPIGFTHIYTEMKKGNVLIAGEEAGGIAVPELMPERDGLLMNLLLCELMAESGKTLGELVADLEGKYGKEYYARRDLRLAAEVTEALRTVLPGLNPPMVAGRKPASVSHMDGLRMEFDDESWLLLRPSGTEPVVRVYAEAPTVEERDSLLDAGCEIARNVSY